MRLSNRFVKPILLTLLCLLAIGSVIHLTRWGAGTTPDSVRYVTAAHSLFNGEGLQFMGGDGSFQPLTDYPPLYPLMLALPGLVGIEPLNFSRWMNAGLYVANILLIVLMVLTSRRKMSWVPIMAATIDLTSFHLLRIHSLAWSEPIFIFLGFLGFWLLAFYLDDHRIRYLVAASFLFSLAWLARYAGIVMIAAAVTAVLLFGNQSRKRRTFDAILLILVASSPMVFWFARNQTVSGSITSRSLTFHLITVEKIFEAFDTFSLWIMPIVIPERIRVALLPLLILAGLVIVIKRNQGNSLKPFKDLMISSRINGHEIATL